MRLIDADANITALIYDEEHEETNEVKMTIADFLDGHTEEGCPQGIGWISVKDRLPEQVKTVLVARKYVQPCHKERRYVETAELIGTSWVSIEDEYKMHLQFHTLPYAWMPMPEPPKEEHDEP